MSQGGNNFTFGNSQGWMGGMGGNHSRSSSCSSLDIAASLFSSLQAAESAAASANNMALNGMMGNVNTFGNTHMNFGGQSAIVGLGPEVPVPTLGGNQHGGSGGDVTMEDVQRFLASNLVNQNGNAADSYVPTNHLHDVAAQFQQIQQQLQIEMSRRSELESLLRIQQHLQQQQGFPNGGSTQNFLAPTGLQQGPHQVSVREGETRSSHGSLSSTSLLNILAGGVQDNHPADGSINNILTSQKLGEHNDANAPQENTSQSIRTDEIMFVPTKDPSPPSSFTKSNGSETSSLFVTEGFNRSRTNSASSFDALLSAVGNDLDELNKESGEPQKESKSILKSHDLHHLSGMFGNLQNNTSSFDPVMAQAQVISQRFMSQANPVLLASLTETNQAMQMNQAGDGNIKKQVKRISSSDTSSCAIELAIKRLSSALNKNPYVAETIEEPPDDPRKDLDQFLEDYGEEGKKARKGMLSAIDESESSLAKIHEWDHSLGLRKCTNRTVVKTRRSRALLKAFLQGVRPPKEPKSRRKKSKIL
jgi:hypothetical protein